MIAARPHSPRRSESRLEGLSHGLQTIRKLRRNRCELGPGAGGEHHVADVVVVSPNAEVNFVADRQVPDEPLPS